MRKDDGFTPEYRSELLVSSADNVGTMPTLWVLPGLLPCHHLSAILAPTGAGLTQLAIQICAHLAPKPTISQAEPPTAAALSPSVHPSSFSLPLKLHYLTPITALNPSRHKKIPRGAPPSKTTRQSSPPFRPGRRRLP